MNITKILVPNKPQLDPIAATYLLGEYGEDKFPGIMNAQISYWEHAHDPSHEEIRQMEAEGTIMIDVGGGKFDHHNVDGVKECATSLVAKYLGIENKPELSALLSYVREDDLEGLHNRFGDLAYIIKCMYKQGATNNKVVEYTLQILNFLQETQKDWHIRTKEEFEAKCKIITTKRNKSKAKIGVIETDDAQVGNYGITVKNMAVMIIKRSTGHVFILTNKHQRIDLREIIGALRKREMELRGYQKELDPKRLRFEGKNQMIPYWFYHKALNALMNGSEALNKTEPTKISLDEIVRFVVYSISTESSELCDCNEGGQNCPYKNYGFRKCLDNKRK